MPPISSSDTTSLDAAAPQILAESFSRSFLCDVRDDRLPQLALAALISGDVFRAFVLADRWCRESPLDVNSLCLRAVTSYRLGEREYALQDLKLALEIEPAHQMLNRRLLEWGDDDERLQAAQILIKADQGTRKRSLAVLAAAGVEGAGDLLIQNNQLTGWAVWKAGRALQLSLTGSLNLTIPLVHNPQHSVVSAFENAAEFALWLPDLAPISAAIFVDGRPVAHATVGKKSPERAAAPAALVCSAKTITIIVPVYGDAEATIACLESVQATLVKASNIQILVIDDASPSIEIKEYLTDFKIRPRRHVVTNEKNLGFLSSVNKALSLVQNGDVILLNADTLVRPNFAVDLESLAKSDSTIGTINPVSNNGEFVSFPIPRKNNALEKNWEIIDIHANIANKERVVDIPCGTGFCLYITRACLDAVKNISFDFDKGYLEDMDFGLRARAAGFRNICAPSIYVAHLGSRSFGASKLALVARNQKTLARKFPDFEDECRAFLELDPLAQARSRIEAGWRPIERRRLLVGPSRIEMALLDRARRLSDQGAPSLVVTIRRDGDHWEAGFRGSGETSPKSLKIRFGHGEGQNAELTSQLRKWRFDRVEIARTQDLPDVVAGAIYQLSYPVDILIVDASPLQENCFIAPNRQICAEENNLAPCVECIKGMPWQNNISDSARQRLTAAKSKCQGVVGIDQLSVSFARTVYKDNAIIDDIEDHHEDLYDIKRHHSVLNNHAIGIILPIETTQVLRFLIHLGERSNDIGSDLFVFGKTSIDQRLIARGLYVSGQIAPVETARIAAQYKIGRWLLPYRFENYWALQIFKNVAPVPAAFFDWSFGSFQGAPDDLSLDPRICDRKAVSNICAWLKRLRS